MLSHVPARGKEEVPGQAARTDIITANRQTARSERRGRKRGIQRRISEAKAQVRSVERRTDRKMNFGAKLAKWAKMQAVFGPICDQRGNVKPER